MPRTELSPSAAIPSDGAGSLASAVEIDRLRERLEHSGDGTAAALLEVLADRLERFDRERDASRRREAWLRDRLLQRAAARCAGAGELRIALYGAGFHTRAIVCHPWRYHGVEVVAIIDDAPSVESLDGVPVLRPDALEEPVDAIVVSSDRYEADIHERAVARFGARGIPVHRIYGDDGFAAREEESTLRRYAFAAHFARGRRVLVVPGADRGAVAVLEEQGRAKAIIDDDPPAPASVDLVVAVEGTRDLPDAHDVERWLAPDGLAVLASPEGADPLAGAGGLVEVERWGQVHADEPRTAGRPPGIYRLDPNAARPDVGLVIARRTRAAASRGPGAPPCA